ncbi:CHAP domain-containing protein [Sphingomonas psychrotolerans]|uniref:CHAP domain-containing protein n=1 Tax=Sphingomonas psychrotolerans TaxID=1327635 RepID=A0A2K8MQI0_9SPHN|nr:CHAP domain-containing protein [Sphingomonas psychrotolerans]ATY33721.1 CHAP domain-containing protein [Sphingomonas psychrotolerans]
MNFRVFAARFALVVSCALMTAVPAQAKSAFLQCVPYARQISGVKIHGNAWTWWGQAAGRYERGNTPRVGAVMSFKKTAKNRFGHVAMVSQIVSDREVLLSHANWSRRGGIERDVRAVDVSAAGDWSEVRVWFAPLGGLGTSSYPINGFIYSDGADDDAFQAPQMANKADKVLVASLTLDLSDLQPEAGIN